MFHIAVTFKILFEIAQPTVRHLSACFCLSQRKQRNRPLDRISIAF